MGLKVFKADEASRDYENDFFREVASNLVQMFKEENLDGILIGHPEVPANKYLKPDCVLITPNRLLIIDFKNHSGKIWLPDELSFEKCPWRHDNTIVEGGGSINPFAQLKKQRNWVEELIGTDIYDKFGIACMVCFQQDMNIMNKVPGKFQAWFSVSNSYQYLNRIRDIIGVKNKKYVDIDKIASYFEAKPYNDYYAVSLKNIESVSEANERMEIAVRREAEAQRKVDEYEAKIAKAESKNKDVEKLRSELKSAKGEALKAREVADKEKQEFDDKRYALELETQKAISAKEYAKKAASDDSRAEKELEKEKTKSKTKKIVATIFGTVVLIAIAAGVWVYIDGQNKIAQQEADRLVQLEEDYRNGRKCIPVERVADFIGNKNVCVDFYANYINESKGYVFIDNVKKGNFALMVPKDLISKDTATSKYLNKHLEARGSIAKFNNTYKIKISNLSQIIIKQE